MTLAEQRLNSNHGRLVRAARAVPPHLRHVPIEGWGWTPKEVLGHVLAWQEEALRRFRDPRARCLSREEIDGWNQHSRERMEDLRWDEIMARIEAAHAAIKPYLVAEEPPTWFAACTYRHYTEHTRTLRGLAQSPTTTVVPIAAQV
jgi:DinB family protein